MESNLLAGHITISKPHGGDEQFIEIDIADENSKLHFITIRVGLLDFTEALFGLAHQPMKFTLKGIENVGKVKAKKTEIVDIPKSFGKTHNRTDRIEIARIACKPFEVDGWVADLTNIVNHHYHPHDMEKASIDFYRFVEVKNG